ncbi:MAG TPA: undecaprenyl-phosphate glucose phosphotransferase [Acidiferrobacteraceae bacterium]|nr:undecaprenyl-phosphate glucose phosphotransferase [Acidiferrobacteraceae bacterium]
MNTEVAFGRVTITGRQGLLRQYASAVAVVQRGVDVVLVLAVFYLLSLAKLGGTFPSHYEVLGLIIALLMLVIYQWVGFYRCLRSSSLIDEAVSLFKPWALLLVSLAVLGVVTKTNTLYSREVLLIWAVVGYGAQVLLHSAVRYGLRLLRADGRNTRRAVMVGNGAVTQQFADRLINNTWLGIQLCGYVTSKDWDRRKNFHLDCPETRRKADKHDVDGRLFLLGVTEDLPYIIKNNNIDLVYITLPAYCAHHIEEVVRRILNLNIDVHWVPDMTAFQLINHNVREVDGQPVLCLSDSPLDGLRWLPKWLEDKCLAVVLLVLLAVPMLAIALGIKFTSPGPVLFKQRRHGLDGKIFSMWKFRSMKLHHEQGGITQARKNDKRITPFGVFLRRTSLDELPQLFNVLLGQMSIVGPRPHAVEHNELYREQIEPYMLRHRIKPGITGWAQVNGLRGETDTTEKMEKRVQYDLYYINNWSISFDIKILIKTGWCVLRGVNAC